MRAVQLLAPGDAPASRRVPMPSPGPGEVRVRIRACGICGSDLHVVDGSIVPARWPITLGHEAAGTVDATGSGVEDDALPTGRPVLINPIVGCGSCAACGRQEWQRCPRHQVLGVARDGAHADHVVVPARNLVPLPDGLGFSEAAILADAVAGPYRAVRRSGLRRGQTVAIFGLGGLGMHAALIARQLYDARVIGIDVDPGTLDRARGLGLDAVYDGRDPRVSRALQREEDGADVCLEFVGRLDVLDQAMRTLRPGGTTVSMGIDPSRLALSLRYESLVARELGLLGSYGYAATDLTEVVDEVARGALDVRGTVTHTFDLDDHAEAFRVLADRVGSPIRVVLTTH